ncbi:DUF3397 domain-containing protein [Oceanobacillus damuensis]|uniref:DUF3397 domain-containing protein n=1 Tax=Oceanobacillus damuensis TaxID=937928 RepID=UPI000829872F|nr:DUF3397 domain-containing protein [Oceanobacillus damuensis]
MFEYIIHILAFFVTLPIIATVSIYFISVKFHNKKLKAVHTAVNWTTVLYIIAVSLLLHLIFDRSFFGWLIVYFILSLSVIIIYQWKTRTEIELGKALKIIWRFSFLLFLLLYVLLVLSGIIQKISS